MGLSNEVIKAQLDRTIERLENYETALAFLAENPTQSYTLDTNQSRTTVTRYDIASLEKQIDRLNNRLVTLCARLDGSGSTHVRPC